MGYRVTMGSYSYSFLFVISFFMCCCFGFSKAKLAPAIYVFGDSLVDVGNNNYLSLSIVKANLPHYGIDFPTKKPTGRFTNGKNAADLIAEKLGLPTSPPYLSLVSNSKARKNKVSFLDGVSFASAGAGIFDGTDELYKQALPLTKQVDYYSKVHQQMTQEVGEDALKKHLSKSIFAVVIGNNDLFDYFDSLGSDSQKKVNKTPPQQYVNSMVSSLKLQLQRLYNYGARKFEMLGVGAIGCCPAYRLRNKTECVSEANDWTVKYNRGLQSMLKAWQSKNMDISYSYFDTYAALQDFIHNPKSYGFAEVKGACCGAGELNSNIPCMPISGYCSNRKDHIFWDLYHPTEAAFRIFVDRIFDGPSNYTYPINLKQLVAL